MADNSSIEWTDATWNPFRGCTRISPGCVHCYAETMCARNLPELRSPTTGEPFAIRTPSGPRWTGKVELIESALEIPLRWRKPRRIFVNSMSDTFHEGVPDEMIDRVFEKMLYADSHTYQILTKRADRMRQYVSRKFPHGALKHIWLGVSVEDQQRADERIPLLLQTPAAVRFLSVEPLLGPVDLLKAGAMHMDYEGDSDVPGGCHHFPVSDIDWVIVGGESGPGARPMHPDWVRSIRDQCVAAGVKFFFKQWGEWQVGSSVTRKHDRVLCNDGMLLGMDLADASYDVRSNWSNLSSTVVSRVGKKAAGRLLDGREWNEMPEAAHA